MKIIKKVFKQAFLIVAVFCSGILNAQVYTISTIAGTGFAGYSNDGNPATKAMVYYPFSASTDSIGNIYIADWDNSRIRKINTAGIISTIAGNGSFNYFGDGGPASSSGLNGPTGVSSDAAGNIYFTDIGNGRIREVSVSGLIHTVAGNGSYGFSGDGGQATAASFRNPTGIAFDGSGNMYVADVFNNRIRKIDANGIITTIAGNGITGYSGDSGPATLAELYYPTGVAVDDSGSIYIADEDNNRIREVSKTGIISTRAGNGIGAFYGDGGLATLASLNFPGGVAVDKQHNVYIADASNNRIRMVNSQGVISTIAGNGNGTYSGDGGPAIIASLFNPTGLWLDALGNILVGDAFNFRVRMLTKINGRELNTGIESLNIYPNPGNGIFNVSLQNSLNNKEIIEIYNIVGEKIFYTNLTQNGITQINLTGLKSGIYLYVVTNENKSVVFRGRLIIINS